jgi:hypothetical protein
MILNGLLPSLVLGRRPDRGSVPGYSVVRRRNSQAAKGAVTARMNADHATPASTGCRIGHALIVADGLGLPQRWRAPAEARTATGGECPALTFLAGRHRRLARRGVPQYLVN